MSKALDALAYIKHALISAASKPSTPPSIKVELKDLVRDVDFIPYGFWQKLAPHYELDQNHRFLAVVKRAIDEALASPPATFDLFLKNLISKLPAV